MRIIETYSLVSWICDTVSLRVNILKIRRKGYLLNHWKKMPCVTNTLMSPVSHFRSSLCSSSSEMVLIDRAGFQRGRNGASEGKEGRRSVWEIEEFESSLKDGKMPHTGLSFGRKILVVIKLKKQNRYVQLRIQSCLLSVLEEVGRNFFLYFLI